MKSNNKVELKLYQSEYNDAMVCNDSNLIHQEQMKNILELFDTLYINAKNFSINNSIKGCNIVHNTLSIFANRGAGKTTFLLSALERIKKKYNDVVCLPPIDPSIIDYKQHPFINIIAGIHKCVEDFLKNNTWQKPYTEKDKLNEYNDSYKKLLKGLPFIDGVGNDNIYQNWDDELFISMQGMEKAEASNNLILYFHEYVKNALNILECTCFVISFDDIDTNFHKGYELLEVIRKYLTSEQIISILTGDLELYGKLVRKASWNCFDIDFLVKECRYAKRDKEEFSNMINHLENQYLLKILKPENRIHLHTINEVIEEDNTSIHVYFSENQKSGFNLDNCYEKLLRELNLPIKNLRVNKGILRFLKSLSLRSQIRILCLIKNQIFNKDNTNKNKNNIVSALSGVFWNDINQKSNNAKKLITPSHFYTVEMQNFLVKNNILYGSINFMPLTNDDTLNKALLSIGAQFNIQAEKYSYLIFDFWLRLCYVQYASESFEGGHDVEVLNRFLNFSSLNDNDDLVKCIGLAEAYCQKENRNSINFENKTMPGTVIVNYNPLILTSSNSILSSLILQGSISETQNETVIASIYKLFAAIRDVLYYIETDDNNYKGSDDKYLNNLTILLNKVMQYRGYLEPNDTFTIMKDKDADNENYNKINLANSKEDFTNYNSDFVNSLAKEFIAWVNSYHNSNSLKYVSTQLLQRIFTRTYFTMTNIDKNKTLTNLGEKINAYIIGFYNAVLVEEAIENNISLANLNSSINIDDIYKNNVEQIIICKSYDLPFYKWIKSCPILKKFTNPFINMITNQYQEFWPLYKLTNINNRISNYIKENDKILKELNRLTYRIKLLQDHKFENIPGELSEDIFNDIIIDIDDFNPEERIKDLNVRKQKLIIQKRFNQFYIKNMQEKRKEIPDFITKDYEKYKMDVDFYNYLCSIEVKTTKRINYDSNSN